jgi:ABC-type cobalt transport system substrate-binding protein
MHDSGDKGKIQSQVPKFPILQTVHEACSGQVESMQYLPQVALSAVYHDGFITLSLTISLQHVET